MEIRNLRRDAADHAQEGGARRRASGPTKRIASSRPLQKTTDRHIAEVDRLGVAKEQEILEV